MKGRFAPSPTGYIHLGNVWIVLLSYLSTRQQQGTYVVRIEDIDLQRSKRDYGEALLDDLEWLGFDWDEGPRVGGPQLSYWQSERLHLYDEVLQSLGDRALTYPCFCNRTRVQSIASAPHRGEIVHHYDGHCRHLTISEVEKRMEEKEPSYRVKVETGTFYFDDIYQGEQCYTLQGGIDDFVLRRGDGMYAYNLAVVIDDIQMGITEVVRGQDLLDTTPQQLYLYNLLGAVSPRYGHAPLLIDSDGHRLSKRQQSITIRELRALQWEPNRILGELAMLAGLIQTSSNPRISLDELLERSINTELLKQKSIIVDGVF